jgi:L-fuculose-phosphate aldolase
MAANSPQIAALKREVCDSGLRLLREGLVARSWGNVSIRVNGDSCLITPSGRLYSELAPQEIVLVQIATNSYQGSLKPSSEVDLHTAIYRARKDVGAIIHTHQPQASVVAAACRDVPVTRAVHRELLGSLVACASYALPSTRKLTEHTFKALGERRAVLLAHHGAVCVGSDIEQAFAVAKTLEQLCFDFVRDHFMRACPEAGEFDQIRMHEEFLKKQGGK